jgi:drug/metabolite transporter (DMT)-like permease
MPQNIYKADSLLMLTAVIWGGAFVAQRVGMDHVGPLTFNGVRFALGVIESRQRNNSSVLPINRLFLEVV